MQRVINFSGGRTSALMTILYFRPGDIVLFTDTGREHPDTYKFIQRFSVEEKIPIHTAAYPGKFAGLLSHLGNSSLPNQSKRFCTVELKIRTAKRYLKALNITHFENLIGFRYDERERVKNHVERFKKITTSFPLYNARITKQDVNEFWHQKTYQLNIPPILGNCTLCFMKGKNALLAILRQHPELAEEWIKDEENKNNVKRYTYIKGVTIKQLLAIAQNNLFREFELNNISPSYSCACSP